MLIFLSSLYFIFAFIFLYTYIKGYSLLRYLIKRKNINVQLFIELMFIILCSFIVFTFQPLNWIVGLIMLSHIAGLIWIISNPEHYYSMIQEVSIDIDSFEITAFITYIAYGVFTYFSKII